MIKTIKSKYYTVEYRDDISVKDKVFERIMRYFFNHESFYGETIQQSDDCIIDAPNVLSDIADNIIKFNVKDNQE